MLGAARSPVWDTWESILRVRGYAFSRAMGNWHVKWLGPFIHEVWRFRTVRSREIVLHHPACFEQDVIADLMLLRWKDELEALERKFGFQLPRVHVFLFSAVGRITEMFGPEYGGLALPTFNAIVVGHHLSVHEDVRHELVHLFAGRWNLYAPPLLSEGLAVHLQRFWSGYPVASVARQCGSRGEWPLRQLLDPSFFFDRTYRKACYMLAGSFTGFLIEEFGWEAYRKLYRKCRPHLVAWAFKRTLGVSFEEAEARWRRR